MATSRRTPEVKTLVREILRTLAPPPSEDVIDEVFRAIEKNPQWHDRYLALCHDLGKDVVNQKAGLYIAKATGREGKHQVKSSGSLIGSYSKLYPSGVSQTPRNPNGDLYTRDETAWLDVMARLIAERRFGELDYEHLHEFLTDMARRDRREVLSRLTALLITPATKIRTNLTADSVQQQPIAAPRGSEINHGIHRNTRKRESESTSPFRVLPGGNSCPPGGVVPWLRVCDDLSCRGNMHLLKFKHQPDLRSNSWVKTIEEQRLELRDLLESGTLRNHAQDVLAKAYERAVKLASIETGLSESTFPQACPLTLEDILERDYRAETV